MILCLWGSPWIGLEFLQKRLRSPRDHSCLSTCMSNAAKDTKVYLGPCPYRDRDYSDDRGSFSVYLSAVIFQCKSINYFSHPFFFKAFFAASVSASCLLFPSPREISSLPKQIATVNNLSWSGPSSDKTLYDGVSP